MALVIYPVTLNQMHKDDENFLNCHLLNQEIYREMVAKAIIEHKCYFLVVEHESNRMLRVSSEWGFQILKLFSMNSY